MCLKKDDGNKYEQTADGKLHCHQNITKIKNNIHEVSFFSILFGKINKSSLAVCECLVHHWFFDVISILYYIVEIVMILNSVLKNILQAKIMIRIYTTGKTNSFNRYVEYIDSRKTN